MELICAELHNVFAKTRMKQPHNLVKGEDLLQVS